MATNRKKSTSPCTQSPINKLQRFQKGFFSQIGQSPVMVSQICNQQRVIATTQVQGKGLKKQSSNKSLCAPGTFSNPYQCDQHKPTSNRKSNNSTPISKSKSAKHISTSPVPQRVDKVQLINQDKAQPQTQGEMCQSNICVESNPEGIQLQTKNLNTKYLLYENMHDGYNPYTSRDNYPPLQTAQTNQDLLQNPMIISASQQSIPSSNSNNKENIGLISDSKKNAKSPSSASKRIMGKNQQIDRSKLAKEDHQELGIKLYQPNNGGSTNYTSRNQDQKQLKDSRATDQFTQQSLCNIASVKNQKSFQQSLTQQDTMQSYMNQDSQKKDRDHLIKLQISDFTVRNQCLQNELDQVKAQAKKDKVLTIQQLKTIEQNYQKYAFFYTKYLEETKIFAQTKIDIEELKQQKLKTDQQSSVLLNVSIKVLDLTSNERLSQGEIISSIQNLICSDVLGISNNNNIGREEETTNEINDEKLQNETSLKQHHEKHSSACTNSSITDAYQSVRKEQESHHQRGRSSSTPKTQFRYQEQKEDDDELYQISDNENKREMAQHIFRNSISSPPPYDAVEERSLIGLRVTHSDRRNSQTNLQVKPRPQRFSEPSEDKSVTETSNVYEYTLKSYQLNESERNCNNTSQHNKVNATESVRVSHQHNFIGDGDRTNTPGSVLINKDQDSYNENMTSMLGNQQTFNQDMNFSKMDTFSPKQFNIGPLSSHLQPNQGVIESSELQLKYSIEFVSSLNESQATKNSENSRYDYPFQLQRSSRKIEIATALTAFEGEKENDLKFKAGEKIIIESRISGSSWVFGSIGLRKGWFPINCVSVEEHSL